MHMDSYVIWGMYVHMCKIHFLLGIMIKSLKASLLVCAPHHPLQWKQKASCRFVSSRVSCGNQIHSSSSRWNHARIIGPSWLKWTVSSRGPLGCWTFHSPHVPRPRVMLPPPKSRVVAKWLLNTSWHWCKTWPEVGFCLVYTVLCFQLLAFNYKSVDFT